MFVSGIALGWKYSLLAAFIGILLAGSYSIYLLVSKKIDKKGHIAFGPYLSIGIFMNTIHILISSKQLFVDLLGMIFPILFCIGIWLSYFQNDTIYNPKGLKLLKAATTLKLFITILIVILVLFVLLPIVYLSIHLDSSAFILSSILLFIVVFIFGIHIGFLFLLKKFLNIVIDIEKEEQSILKESVIYLNAICCFSIALIYIINIVLYFILNDISIDEQWINLFNKTGLFDNRLFPTIISICIYIDLGILFIAFNTYLNHSYYYVSLDNIEVQQTMTKESYENTLKKQRHMRERLIYILKLMIPIILFIGIIIAVLLFS